MKTIWKYPIGVGDSVSIPMHAGAQILTVQTQHKVPTIWALVDTDAPMARRRFVVRGTGWQWNPDEAPTGEYVGTFQIDDGRFVFHLFEVPLQS